MRTPRRGDGGWPAILGLILAVGFAGGRSAPVTTTPAVAPTSPSPSPVPAAGLGFSDADNGRSATVSAGQRITVILHNSGFVFSPSSDPSVLAEAGPATVNPGGTTCVEVAGSGCGTVVASFVALAAGDAVLGATRPGCEEPACLPADAHWELLVHVEALEGSTTTSVGTTSVGPSTSSLTIGATTTSTTTSTTASPDGEVGDVGGRVFFSPVCPVERVPPDPACAPRPGPADVELVTADGRVAARARAGEDGSFTIPVAPGRYEIRASVPGPGFGGACHVEPAEVTVESGASVPVAVSCDTGIR